MNYLLLTLSGQSMVEKIEKLLKKVSFKIGTVREARNLFATQLAPDFRIFDYLRTDEMGLSNCIAALLDHKGSHGQGSIFIEEFLKNLDSKADWAVGRACEVSVEKNAMGRRIDIYLKFDNGIIGIENKPWAADQNQQLQYYSDYLKKHATEVRKNWLLVFISDRDPSPDSIKEKSRISLEKQNHYIRCDYGKVIDWLEVCANKSKALIVRLFAQELIKFIRSSVRGEFDMSEVKETRNVILESSDNLLSAFHISDALHEVKESLLFESLYPDLKKRLDTHGFQLDWNFEEIKDQKKYAGFSIALVDLADKYLLRFQFDSSKLNSFVWGICRESTSVKYNKTMWENICLVMDTRFGDGESSEDWPWWRSAPDKEFDAGMSNWSTSSKPWIDIQDGKLAIQIEDLACEVSKAFKVKKLLNLLTGNS